MEVETSFSHMSSPIFDGENYQLWAVKMETYLDVMDLWEAVEEDYEVHPLPNNPTVAQIKNHKERKTRKSKAKACLFAAVSTTIFTRIMSLQSAKDVWDYLKREYTGDERIRGMQSLNLIREFELQRMKDSESIKEYSDKLLGIVNKVRLLGISFSNSRIVEKILVTVPEKYEASITTLENTKDLCKITLAELLNALQAQEQRRLMRQDQIAEGALSAKHQDHDKNKRKFIKKFQGSINEATASTRNQGKGRNSNRGYPPCKYCGRTGHPPFKCWKRPDAKRNKCNQLGHEAVICKNKFQMREADAQIAKKDDEDQILIATCFSTKSSSECWLIDSGCTNHMTYDRTLFKDLQSTKIIKVRIENGDYISAKGKGTISITTNSGTKSISDVLYVPEIDQNLLSVGQLIEKGFKVTFEDHCCLIYDAAGQKILQVKMKGKSFSFFPTAEEDTAYSTNTSITETWHKRLGHCHLQRMLIMKKNEVIRGLPALADQMLNCHAC